MDIFFNGECFPTDQPIFTALNRSFRYGDGLFETMKFYKEKLLLEDLHFERLFSSLQLLQIETAASFTRENLRKQIGDLCKKNNCEESARIRLTVYRNESNEAGYVVEAIPFDAKLNEWQSDGLHIGLYPNARKSTDAFANIKSANFLSYVLAQKYAQDNNCNDAIVLNTHNRLCDTSKANVFLVIRGVLFTPALHQGCINGVMRRTVIGEIKKLGLRLQEDEIPEELLWQADEVFLTNAIQVIRWVRLYKDKTYTCELTKEIFKNVSATIFPPSC